MTILYCKKAKTARKECPDAAKIIKENGAFYCFDTLAEYLAWRNRK